jgi:hypothetical protein
MIAMTKRYKDEETRSPEEQDAAFSAYLRERMHPDHVSMPRPSPELLARLAKIPQENPAKPRFSWRRLLLASLPPTLGIAALAAFWFFQSPDVTAPLLQPQTRDAGAKVVSLEPQTTDPAGLYVAKGASWRVLYAHQKDDGTTSPASLMRDGSTLYPGDLVQWTYNISTQRYVFFVGMNREGQIYPMLPAKEDAEAFLLSSGKGAFPQENGKAASFRLDRYVGAERFFVIQKKEPFSYAVVKAALQQAWKEARGDLRKLKPSLHNAEIESIFFKKAARE